MLSISLRQLEYALAIHRHGGVSAAAAALRVSQPALSTALGQIETKLGKSLFLRRSGGPMTPTSFGREFLSRAQRVVDGAADLMRPDGVAANEPVILWFFQDLAPLLLAPVLAELTARLPDIEIKHRVGGFQEIMSAHAQFSSADLAITYDLGLDRGFHRREILRLPLSAIVAAGHEFARRGFATMAEIAVEPIVLAEEGLSKAHMLKVFSDFGLSLDVVHIAGTMETMRSFAANGLGVGLAYTRPLVETTYDGKPVRHVPISDATSLEPVILVHSRKNSLSAAATTVRDAIAAMKLPAPPRSRRQAR
jgi:DNA-binding transcriptional LysR family regulator